MYSTQQTIWTVFVPAAISLLTALIAWPTEKKSDRWASVLVVLGVMVAILVGYLAQFPRTFWPPPRDMTRLLTHLSVVGGVIGVGLSLFKAMPGVASVVNGVAAGLLVAFVTRNPKFIAVALGFALLARTAYPPKLQDRQASMLALLLWTGSMIASGFLLAATGSLALSQQAMIVACALLGVLVGSVIARRSLFAPGVQSVVMATWLCVMAAAVGYSKTQLWQAVVLAFVMSIGSAATLPGIRDLKPWKRFVLIATAGAAIAGAVSGHAFYDMMRELKADPYAGYK